MRPGRSFRPFAPPKRDFTSPFISRHCAKLSIGLFRQGFADLGAVADEALRQFAADISPRIVIAAETAPSGRRPACTAQVAHRRFSPRVILTSFQIGCRR